MPRALTVCSTPACPNLTDHGRCTTCQRDAEQARGSASQRGYTSTHERKFRRAVLRHDRVCALCPAPSTVADHYPRSRRELVELGLDADDPQYGRGLCASCHGRETARHQPGGWNADR